MKLIADTHSHTLASGHAYSTIREMVRAAFEKGMEAFAITEHGPKMPDSCGRYYFNNLRVVPRKLEGVDLFLGVEANLMDPEGTLDLREDILKQMDIVIASIHVPCYGLEHTEKDTVLVQKSIHNAARVANNLAAKLTLEMEARGTTLQELMTVISGKLSRQCYKNGNIDGGIYALGPAMGLIRDIKTVQELMDGMVDEAEAVINGLRSGIC